MTESFAVVPAAYVLFLRDTPSGAAEVLLQLREGTGYMDGYWATAAAGHVERGESVFAAAAREVTEELGVTGVHLAPLDVARGRGGPVAVHVPGALTQL